MANIMITVLSSVLFIVASVSAVCDENTQTQITACLQKSKDLIPQTEMGYEKLCQDYGQITTCVQDIVNECADNDKEKMMIKLLVDQQALTDYFNKTCMDKEGNTNIILKCDEKVSDTNSAWRNVSDCMRTAAGNLVNAGQQSDLKDQLDVHCTYNGAMQACPRDNLGTMKNCGDLTNFLVNYLKAFRFPYCDMTEAEKTAKLQAYKFGISGSNHIYSYTSLVVFSVFMIFTF